MTSPKATTTRRAVLGVLAAAPALALPSAVLAETPASPLQGFAEAWLRRFTEKGGIYHYDRYQERFVAWIPEYHFSPQYERDKAIVQQMSLPGRNFERNMEWRGTFYDGKMRELYAIAQGVPGGMEDVPGGMEAIEAAVQANPSLGVPVYPEAL